MNIFWVVVICVVIYWLYTLLKNKGIGQQPRKIEDIEDSVYKIKVRIFELEPLFDSPHFIDYQNAYEAMEVNYLRLKQRFTHTPEKALEIALDWESYVQALSDLRFARVMLDVDLSDTAWENAGERMKEPSIIVEEVEKKFKGLLGKDWLEKPPDYFKRMEAKKKPGEKDTIDLKPDSWKQYYLMDKNFEAMEKMRAKLDEERKQAEEKTIKK